MTTIDTDNRNVIPAPASADPERDWMLQTIAAGLQESGNGDSELQLTVTVGGLLISGIAIGRNQWFRETALFMEDTGGPGAGDIAKTYLIAIEEQEAEASPDATRVYAFLHMKDAKTISPNGMVPSGNGIGMYWRGRISEITGFSFGQLKAS